MCHSAVIVECVYIHSALVRAKMNVVRYLPPLLPILSTNPTFPVLSVAGTCKVTATSFPGAFLQALPPTPPSLSLSVQHPLAIQRYTTG